MEKFFKFFKEKLSLDDEHVYQLRNIVLNENNLPTSNQEDGDLYFIGEYSNTPPTGMTPGQCGIAIWSASNNSWIFGTDELNKEYILENFIPEIGNPRIKEFCEYYNVTLNSAEIIIQEISS